MIELILGTNADEKELDDLREPLQQILTREEARHLLSDLKTAYLSLAARDRATVSAAVAGQTSAVVLKATA